MAELSSGSAKCVVCEDGGVEILVDNVLLAPRLIESAQHSCSDMTAAYFVPMSVRLRRKWS